MTTKKTIPEEWLSAYLDGECTVEEKAAVEKALQENPEYRVLLDNFHALHDALRSSSAEPPGFKPLDIHGMKGPSAGSAMPKISQPSASEAPEPAVAALDRETLQQILADRDRMHERSMRAMAWTATLSGLAGMAAALLIGGFFFWNAIERRPAPEVRVVAPPSAPATAAAPTAPTVPVMQAGVKTPLQEPPVPEIEALATTPNSCIIENINSADDINTAVFQIPDENGEMITVIWLTGIDAGNTI